MEFKKAFLQAISEKPNSTDPVGPKIEVQINPATLRYQMASTVDFGKDAGRQKTTYQGSTSTLSFDLVFDSADQGTTESPVDVRTRTRQLESFVLPQKNKTKAVPPRLQFTYGTFTVIGAMTALNQDFDLFSANGVPLRAKCAVTIKEQKPEFDANKAGPGANTGTGATSPVPGGAGPGSGRWRRHGRHRYAASSRRPDRDGAGRRDSPGFRRTDGPRPPGLEGTAGHRGSAPAPGGPADRLLVLAVGRHRNRHRGRSDRRHRDRTWRAVRPSYRRAGRPAGAAARSRPSRRPTARR